MQVQIKDKTRMRELESVTSGQPAMDGDGVRMTRVIGTPELNMLDPFLLLDAFESDQSEDYIGGFPDHPHRGFETVTYLLAGRMRHKDSVGHEGLIEAGGVQWMTAGRGIIHSEMPEQENGLLHGFQLWVNLPASEKMQKPVYQEFTADEVAFELQDNDIEIRVITGTTNAGTQGPVINRTVDPLYLDVSLPKGKSFEQAIAEAHKAFVYVISGELNVGHEQQAVGKGELGVLSQGSDIGVTASTDARFLLIAAKPLNEPVERGGPFVMNTKAEVLQAFEDFHKNRFLEN